MYEWEYRSLRRSLLFGQFVQANGSVLVIWEKPICCYVPIDKYGLMYPAVVVSRDGDEQELRVSEHELPRIVQDYGTSPRFIYWRVRGPDASWHLESASDTTHWFTHKEVFTTKRRAEGFVARMIKESGINEWAPGEAPAPSKAMQKQWAKLKDRVEVIEV
jgi:hypothetical protein